MASLILAVIAVAWHLPLFMIGDIVWPDVLFIPVGYIVLTWIYNCTEGSILMTMLTHATLNTVSGGFFSLMFSGKYAVRQALLLALGWGVVVLVLIVTGKLQPRSVEDALIRPSLAEAKVA